MTCGRLEWIDRFQRRPIRLETELWGRCVREGKSRQPQYPTPVDNPRCGETYGFSFHGIAFNGTRTPAGLGRGEQGVKGGLGVGIRSGLGG